MNTIVNTAMNTKVQLPLSEIQYSAVRSRGAGGQHVNRTASAVILSWNVQETEFFSVEQKRRLLEKLAHRLSGEGLLQIRSEEFRDQLSNKKCCLVKFQEILDAALFIPKKRKKTRPSFSSVKKRLTSKRVNAEKKQGRQRKFDRD